MKPKLPDAVRLRPVSVTALAQPRFGEILKRARAQRGLTIRQAAKESKVPPATWCRVEAGLDVMLSTAYLLMLWVVEKGLPES